MLGADHHGYVGRLMAMCQRLRRQAAREPRGPDRSDGQPGPGRRAAADVASAPAPSSYDRRPGRRDRRRRGPLRPGALLERLQHRPRPRRSGAGASSDNPVYYVQYAHARLRLDPAQRQPTSASRRRPATTSTRPCSSHEREGDLLRALAEFPSVIASAAELREPHRVARYLEATAATFHRFYDACRVLPQGTRSRPRPTERGCSSSTRPGSCSPTASVCSASPRPSGCRCAPTKPVPSTPRPADRGPVLARGAARPQRHGRCSCGLPMSPRATTVCSTVRGVRVDGPGPRVRHSLYVVDEHDFRARARAFRDCVRRRGRLLRRQGVPDHRESCGGSPKRDSPSTSAPAASSPSRSRPGLRSRRGSASTATTRASPSSTRAVEVGVGRSSSTRQSRSSASPRSRARAACVSRAAAGDSGVEAAHPRVPRDRARRPEVRLLDRRGRCPRGDDVHPRRPRVSRLDRASLPHRLADLRHRRLRGRGPPGPRSCTPRLSRAAASPCSTSAAASASPTRRRTTRRRLEELADGDAPTSSTHECAVRGIAIPHLAIEPGAPSSAPPAFTLYEVGTVKPVALDDGASRLYVSGRRRHERQHPPRALRRRLLVHASRRARPTPPPFCRASSASTASPATSSSRTSSCPATSRPATCSRCPRPAPTAARSRATTTTCLDRPVVAVRDGEARVIVRRETVDDLLRLDVPCRADDGADLPISLGRLAGDPQAHVRQVRDRCHEPAPAGRAAGRGRRRLAGGALLSEQATTWSTESERRSSWSGSRCAIDRTARRRPAARAVHDRCRGLVTRGDIDVVIELIGGIEPARSLILQRSTPVPSVVTANKALLADDGATIFEAAEKAQRDVYFEAAVGRRHPDHPAACASRSPATACAASSASSTAPPTTSSTRWTPTGAGFDDALEEAQSLGYAEADPTADVEGFDAAAKAAILASLAFHTRVTLDDVHREGISRCECRQMSRRRARWVRRQAARDLRADEASGRRTRSRCASTRR